MNHHQPLRRFLATVLSIVMVLGLIPLSAVAETPPTGEGGEILSFEMLPEATATQAVPFGTPFEDLNLPDTLTAVVYLATYTDVPEPIDLEGDKKPEAAEMIIPVPVTWKAAPDYDGYRLGTYTFTAEIGGFTVSAEAPAITVTVEMPVFSARSGTGADYSWYDPGKWAFEIGSETQLQGLANIVNGNYGEATEDFLGKTITLTGDLDLSGYENWTPIGSSPEKPFFGTFEGGKHTISNLTINEPDADYIGLFGMVKGSVKDVILMDVDITGWKNVGGIAGEVWNNTLNHCAVVGGQVTGHENVGGIVGRAGHDPAIIGRPPTESRIERCFATCDVFGTGISPLYVGGVAGIVEYGNLLNCYATGSVRDSEVAGLYDQFYSVGGVAGRGNCASIIGCYATGNVVGTTRIGGIVGTMGGDGERPSRLENCIALNGLVAGDPAWYDGPKTGRVVGAHTYTGITNICASSTMARLGDGGAHGPDITPEKLQTEEAFISFGFPEPAWIGGMGKVAILADYPEGLQSADIPWHVISGAPSIPVNVTAVYGDQTVTVSWATPTHEGISAITRYEVCKDSDAWISVGMSTSYTFTGLVNETTYIFKIRAVNSNGESQEATIQQSPGVPPAAVQNPIVVQEGNTLTLFWEKPAGTINEIGVNYEVRHNDKSFMDDTRTWDPVYYPSYSKGYHNGSADLTFTLQIRAWNFYGIGPVTEISGSRNLYPTPPRTLMAAAGNGQVTLSWSVPEYQSGSITSYQVFHPVSKTWVSAGMATSYTVTGLTNGVSYRFFIRAVNGSGNGTSGTLTATPISPPVITSGNSYSLTYGAGGSFQVQATSSAPLTFSLTGAPAGVDIGGGTGLISIGKTTSGGSHPFTVTVSNGALPDATQSFTLTIGKANNTLSISCADITYGASPAPSVVTNTSGGAVTYEYKLQGAADGTYTNTVPAGAGSYTVRGTSTATTNYNTATATANFTIHKANNSLSISCPNITYGASPAPSVGTNTSGGTVTYEYKEQGAADSTYTATAPTGAGSYTVRGTASATPNYNAATATVDFTIGKAENTLVISCTNITYGATPAPSVGTNTSEGEVTYEYKLQGADDDTYTGAVPTEAGSYTVRGTSAATANYNAAIATADFTIGKENNTLSISCADIIYGATPAPSVETNISGGEVTYEYKSQGAEDDTYTVTVPAQTGDYTVRGTSAATANYNAATATADFTISKAEPALTLTADPTGTCARPGSVVLSAVLPADATGALTFRSGTDTIETITLPDKTTSFIAAGPVNDYSFTVEYSGDSNYDSKNSTALAYSFTKSEQADIVVLDGTVSYGDTLDVSSLANGGSGSGVFSFAADTGPGELSGIILTPTGTGEVVIMVTKAADDDYNAKTSTFKVRVNPRVITFTVAAVETQTYMGSPLTPEPEVRDGSMVLRKDTDFTYGYSNNTGAGTATITITGLGNYAGSTGSVEFSINSSGGSSGSSGGDRNSNPVTAPPAEISQIETTVSGNNSTVTTTVTATTDNSGKAAAAVTQAQVSEAVGRAVEAAAQQGNNTAAVVEIKVEAPADARTVEIGIPKDAIGMAADGKTELLTVSTPVAAISFDAKALATIAGEAAGDVKITAAKVEASSLSAEAQQAVGDRPVFNFSVTSGDRTISQFGGNVSVSVPYTPKAGEDINAIVIYYINAEGQPEMVSNCIYDPATGMVNFKTDHFSQYVVGYNKVSFQDVAADAWYKEAVGFIAARSITNGTGKGSYNPEAKLTRGELLVMLMKTYGIAPNPNPKDNFTDAGDTWYTGYLAAAKRLGISAGVGNNRFAPDQEITRQDLAVFLYRYAQHMGITLPKNNTLSGFADDGDIAAYAAQAVNAMQEAGIISGKPGNMFDPQGQATRAEVSSMLHRYIKLNH